MADEETAKIKKMLEATFETGFKELAKYADDLPDYKPIVDYFVTSIFKSKVTEWKGYKMSGQGFSCDTIKWVYENWTPWKDDVIVASFPKTGTTWVRNIVAHLYYRDNKTLMEMVKPMAMPHIYLETGIPLKFEILEKLPWKRRIFATHVSAPLFNFEKVKSAGAKVIYTIRNPKDQVVSWYNMMQNFPFQATDVNAQKMYPNDWNAFFEAAVSGSQLLGNKEGEWYMENILSWYPHRNDDNVLFVIYEDLKRDPTKEIKRIAKFLGTEYSDEVLSEIVEATSFGSMKKNANPTEEFVKFFRKGEVGDWKNHLTVAQSELIDAIVKEKLADTDIEFTYEL